MSDYLSAYKNAKQAVAKLYGERKLIELKRNIQAAMLRQQEQKSRAEMVYAMRAQRAQIRVSKAILDRALRRAAGKETMVDALQDDPYIVQHDDEYPF